MIKVSTIEISLGAIALTATAAGSFLIAGGPMGQLPVFIGLSLAVSALAAAIVASRVSQYRLEMRTRLFDLLPSERACEPTAVTQDSLDESEILTLLESHLRQQEALLTANCRALMQGQSHEMNELSNAEDELRQLRAEIEALEDQFRTEQNRFNSAWVNTGFYPPAA